MNALRRFRRVALGLLAAAAVAVPAPALGRTGAEAGGAAGAEAAQSGAGARPSTEVTLSVMTQNMFYGGDDYNLNTGGFCRVADGCPRALHRIADAIRKAGADVVGLQEPERNTAVLAGLLGWYSSRGRTSSRATRSSNRLEPVSTSS